MEELYDTVIHSLTFLPPTAPTGLPAPGQGAQPAQEPTVEATPDPAAFLPTPEEVEQMMRLSMHLVESVPYPLPAPDGLGTVDISRTTDDNH